MLPPENVTGMSAPFVAFSSFTVTAIEEEPAVRPWTFRVTSGTFVVGGGEVVSARAVTLTVPLGTAGFEWNIGHEG